MSIISATRNFFKGGFEVSGYNTEIEGPLVEHIVLVKPRGIDAVRSLLNRRYGEPYAKKKTADYLFSNRVTDTPLSEEWIELSAYGIVPEYVGSFRDIRFRGLKTIW